VYAGTRTRRKLEPVAFRPPRALGVIVGGALMAWALVAAFLAARLAIGAGAEFKTFLAWVVVAVCAGLALAFANWAYSVLSLSYIMDRDTLTIRWGFRRVVIPIDAIQRLVPGRTLDEAQVDGLNWWGCHVGSSDVKRMGYTLFYSTHSSPEELLYLVTNNEAYALTVLDQAAFAEEIQARAALGPVERHVQRSEATGIAALPFWRDHVALVVAGIAGVACAMLGGYVFASYPGLPQVVELSFPALGGVVRVGDKEELLSIVYLGVGILVLNTVAGISLHAMERAAGLWMVASSGILQVILLGAAVVAFSRA
jgi:hypothetical protein